MDLMGFLARNIRSPGFHLIYHQRLWGLLAGLEIFLDMEHSLQMEVPLGPFFNRHRKPFLPSIFLDLQTRWDLSNYQVEWPLYHKGSSLS